MNYSEKLNEVARDIKPSGIRKYFDIAQGMDDVISLGVGEPDFPTPWHIRQAGIETLQQGLTRYTTNAGLVELREAICDYLKRRFDLSYQAKDQLMITVGGSEAIDLSIRTLVRPNDEVLIVEPCFVCYDPIVRLAGGIPVAIATNEEDQFKLTPELLKKHITDKTKLLILAYPNNPTGAIMTKEDLEKIAPIILENDLLVLSDEIYAELNYTDQRHVSIANLEGMQERTLLVGGFSKSYSMTGWRLGYVCGPKEFISVITKLHQYAIMCAPTTAQYAGIEAMNHGDDDIARMRDEYNMRRRYIVDAFNKMGLHCFEPLGAFYVFPSIQSTGLSSDEFCEQLLYQQKVAVVPGNAFGNSGEGFIRVSYCYSLKHLKEAVKRIEAFIQSR